MRIHISSGPVRRKPRTGDLRTTKKHGLQVRIPERVQHGPDRGAYIKRSGRLSYVWVSPAQAREQGYGHLVPSGVAVPADSYPAGYMQQRGSA